MIVREIVASGFMNYAQPQSVELPTSGLVLVTGENGGGKSSLIEAVSMAGFGKTLRGRAPWTDGTAGFVKMKVDPFPLFVTRDRDTSGRMVVKFNDVDRLDTKTYENNTKTQEALEERLGSFEMWRRSCVFSSDDVERFTTATDADRKRFLEGLTDPEGRLESGSKAVRRDIAALERETAELESRIALLEERHDGAERRLADARRAQAELSTAKTTTDPTPRLKELEAAIPATTEKLTKLETQRDRIDNAHEELGRDLAMCERDHQRLAKSTCPSCGQKISKTLKDDATTKWRAAKKAVDDAEAIYEKKRDELTKTIDALEAEVSKMREERATLRARAEEFTRSRNAREMNTRLINSILHEQEDTADEIDTVRAKLSAKKEELARLGHVDSVLGTRGLRSYFLTRLLSHIEGATNEWLERLCGEHEAMSIKLRPYTEKKTGGVSDVIAMDMNFGGGHYKGASGGERRRVDIAMMLAMAEVKNGVRHNTVRNTMFFDEVFDALDEPGVEAAAEVLKDLARTRCVVVISHNQQLLRYLPDCIHLVAEGGKITRQ